MSLSNRKSCHGEFNSSAKKTEREYLRREAGNLSLTAYIKKKLFGFKDGLKKPSRNRPQPTTALTEQVDACYRPSS